MLPYKTILRIDKKSRTPIYLQISSEFIKHISSGIIKAGVKLPGTRQLSEILEVNRRTVIAAFDELLAQGWINVVPNRGCFVKNKLPNIKPKTFSEELLNRENHHTSFSFHTPGSTEKAASKTYQFTINDGYPDVRLAPLKELSKNYSYILGSPMASKLMTYSQSYFGDDHLRNELVSYLSETRSIHVDKENILITRGSLMAFFILFKTILSPKENQVIVGYPGYNEGYKAIESAGGNLNFVNVDAQGMDTNEVEDLCKKKKIKAVFIIPHHHYPTTVSLSASRRMELLILADKYGFAIVEDDYDYDFHYDSAPILPISSMDRNGSVAYIGSFSKTIAPSLRIGFIVAPKSLIRALAHTSKFIDSFGNTAMERAVAMLFNEGLVRRHLRKALKTYHERRDHFCDLLSSELGEYLDFKKPEGGLAIWAKLKNHQLEKLVVLGQKNLINIPDELSFNNTPFELNALRIGFASMNVTEAEQMIIKLEKLFQAK